MRRLALAAFLLLLLPVYAQELPIVSLHLRSAESLQPLSDGILSLSFSNAQEGQIRSILLLNGSWVTFPLPAGKWDLLAVLDQRNADAPGWAAQVTLNVAGNGSEDLVLEPVASVSGMVVDANGSAVEGARVGLHCATPLYEFLDSNASVSTDEFGSFAFPHVPLHTCRLLASQGVRVGFQDLDLRQGEARRVKLALTDKKVAPVPPAPPSGADAFLISIALLLAVAFLLIFLYLLRKRTQAPKPSSPARRHPAPHSLRRAAEPAPSSSLRRTPKMTAILKTLPEAERRVVEYLLENKGRARLSKIFHALLIPKTTLVRVLFALENKNIVSSTRFGKVRDLELTKWFFSEK